VDSGFDLDRVLAFRTSAVYDEPADRWAPRIGGWLDELSALPGVESAAASFLMLPGVPVESAQEFRLADAPSNGAEALVADWRVVSPGYFATMGVPLLAGDVCRAPAEAGGESAVSAMVNRRFADRYLVGRPVVGLELARTIPAEFGGVSVTRVVGIVGDARERGRTHDPVPTVYQCGTLDPNPWFVVRTGGDPSQAAGSVRAKMRELAPLRPVYPIAPLESLIDDVYATDRLRTVLLTSFAISALSLACLGVYATLSYAVTLRHREVGVRVALGALSRNIVAQFLLKAFGVVAAACLIGLALSLALARALSGMLYGVSPWDPATFVAVVLMVVAVAGAAALIPALRAARADPTQALRAE
jgi:putative ABC transport system permease protein